MIQNKYLILLIALITMFGCKSIISSHSSANQCNTIPFNVDIFDGIAYSYERRCTNLEGLEYVYIVDTIHIKDPIIITSDGNNQFVMPKLIIDLFDLNSNDFFTSCPDVYLYRDFSIPSGSRYISYNIDDTKNFTELELKTKRGKIKALIDTRKQTDYIILLISGDYYNNYYHAFDKKDQLKFGNNKFNYYKLAVPIDKSYRPEPIKRDDPQYFQPNKTDSLIAR